MDPNEINDVGIESMSVAIVEQAADDYFGSRFRADTAYLRPHIGDQRNQHFNNENKRKYDDAVRFFESDWFRLIAGYKFTRDALKILDRRYRESIFLEKVKLLKSRYGTQLDPIKLAIITQFVIGGDEEDG